MRGGKDVLYLALSSSALLVLVFRIVNIPGYLCLELSSCVLVLEVIAAERALSVFAVLVHVRLSLVQVPLRLLRLRGGFEDQATC